MWDVVLPIGSNHKLSFCMFTFPVLKHTHLSINRIYTHAIISPGPQAEMIMPLRSYGLCCNAEKRKKEPEQKESTSLHSTKRYLKLQSAQ